MPTTLRHSSVSLDRVWLEIHGPGSCENEAPSFWRNEQTTDEPLAHLLERLARNEIEVDHERQADIRVCSCVFDELNRDPNLI